MPTKPQSPNNPHLKTKNRKSRGAPPGNRNAFQHGYYARSLPPVDWEQPASPLVDSLENEIRALRFLIDRLASLQDRPDPDLKDPQAPFRVILLASSRLDTLLQYQNTLHHSAVALEQAHFLRDFHEFLWGKPESAGDTDHSSFEEPASPNELLTVYNLEKVRISLGGKYSTPFQQVLPPDFIQKCASIFADPDLEEAVPKPEINRSPNEPG